MIFQEYDIIVIGAGPSGVAASVTSALNVCAIIIYYSVKNIPRAVIKIFPFL